LRARQAPWSSQDIQKAFSQEKSCRSTPPKSLDFQQILPFRALDLRSCLGIFNLSAIIIIVSRDFADLRTLSFIFSLATAAYPYATVNIPSAASRLDQENRPSNCYAIRKKHLLFGSFLEFTSPPTDPELCPRQLVIAFSDSAPHLIRCILFFVKPLAAQ
jgi:hypothetical protein